MIKKFLSNNNKKPPIFLLGTARSGTTLLQRILNSAEDITIWGEHGGFLTHVAEAYFLNLEDKNVVSHIPKQHKPFHTLQGTIGKLKKSEFWPAWHNWYSQEEVNDMFRSFVEGFFNPYGLKNNVFWGFKEIRYGKGCRTLEMLLDLYPDAKFIFIHRNPVDVVASYLFRSLRKESALSQKLLISQAKELKEKEEFSEKWKFFIEKKAEGWTKQNIYFLDFKEKNSPQSLLVSYEDMISEPSIAESIMKWLDVSYSSEKILKILEMKEGRGESVKVGGGKCRSLLTNNEIDKIREITQEFTSKVQLTL